jgi:cytochrome c peroxidase
MNRPTILSLALLTVLPVFTVLSAEFDNEKIKELRESAISVIGVLPDKMPGAEKDNPALVKLGEKLYFEKRLSENNTMSCNTCHQVDRNLGGVDNEPTSPGAFGKRGGRNSPTVLNAGFQIAQFWDGRAETLEAQAKGPILNPIEMAMASDADVLERLRSFVEYKPMFEKAFPTGDDRITYDNVARAIAAFERTLITRDRFDDWQKGDDKALNSQELRGLDLFLNTGCATCHNGPVLGGNQYQKVGLVNKYDTDDLGRYDVTKDDSDKFKFKVPMLRNIALTAPYFHDGKITTLEETIKLMAWLQLGQELTNTQARDIAAFLHALTDKPREKPRS